MTLVVGMLMVLFGARLHRVQRMALNTEARDVDLAQTLRYRIERQVSRDRALLLFGSSDHREFPRMDATIWESVSSLRGRISNPAERRLIDEIDAGLRTYERDVASLGAARYSHQRRIEYFEEILRPKRDALWALLDRLIAEQDAQFRAAIEASTGAGWRSMLLEASLMLGLFALLAATAVFASRSLAEVEAAKANLEELVGLRTRKLERTVAQLEAFVYSVAHDLRGPARAITAFSELALRKGAAIDAESQGYLRRVVAAGERMRSMLDGLLALSRISQDELHLEPVDLSAMAEEVGAELAAHEPGRQVQFEVAKRTAAAADPRLLRILLQNLIENAWKFSRGREPARVQVGAETRDGTPVYFVRDNGPGFDPALAARLFQPFHRLPNAENVPGLGIGLASAARIVQAHGGRIWVESRPGQGATFFFVLGNAP